MVLWWFSFDLRRFICVLVFLYGWLYFRAYFGLFYGFMGFVGWYRFKLG